MSRLKLVWFLRRDLIKLSPVLWCHEKYSNANTCLQNYLPSNTSIYKKGAIPWKVSPGILVNKRFKYGKKVKEEDSDNENYSDDEDYGDSKLITGHVASLRLDAILKAGLGMARNKIEVSFYEDKIRLNGRKVVKKSQKVNIGDEIDLIKGPSPMNTALLNISRVVLVSAKENEDGDKLVIKMKRYKSLSVDYEDS